MRILPAAIAVLFVACAARAQQSAVDPKIRPSVKVLNCTEAGCHSEQTSWKVMHGPTAVGACDACHNYTDPAAHTFELKRQGKELCNFCHIDKTGTEGPVVHKPVADGRCVDCHNPHGSNQRQALKGSTIGQLCTECHKDITKGSHVHKPVAEDCTACHKSHTASEPKLLKQEKRSLCMSCHEAVGRGIANARHVHEPAKGDCLQCHTAHASDHARGLKEETEALCISCHKGVGTIIAEATHPHSAVKDAKACLNCHSAHSSQHEKQLADDPVASCLQCHRKAIEVENKPKIAGVPEVANTSLHRHGPIQQDNCEACHDVHGGKERALLVRPYSQAFQQSYSDQAYALCLGCHDKATLLGDGAAALTRFRDGTRNLHVVHVSGQNQGRSCRSCHSTHASKNEFQIAESVPFGNWSLPINFRSTPTGGSCAPGCHKAQPYDREMPAGKAPSLGEPTSQPGPVTPQSGPPIGPPVPR